MSQQINYKLKYHNFIDKRRQRPLTREKGYALHHILPKSLGGTNEDSNMVKLSHREHWVAHRMLAKMYSGKNRTKMYHALWYMAKTSPYKCNSRTYEHIKLEHSKITKRQWKNGTLSKKAHSDRFKKLWQDPVWRAKLLEKRAKTRLLPEVRKKYSENGKKGCIARWGH